jgi:hypothetical protein
MQGNFDLVSTRLKHAEAQEEMNGQVQETLLDLKARLDAAEQKNDAVLAELNANIDKAAKATLPAQFVRGVAVAVTGGRTRWRGGGRRTTAR